MARRKKIDVNDELEENDDEEEVESEEAEGGELPSGGDSGEGAGGPAGEGDSTDEDDSDEEEEVRDPVARAVAQTEARMRKKYKPLRQEVARLRQEAEAVSSLRLENTFLRLAGAMFHDAAAAFKLADTSQVQIKEGTVTGMQEVVDALAESHPYLVREGEPIPVDEEDYLNAPDLPSGRPMNSGRRNSVSGPKTSDAALYRKYPALQRRRWGR